MKIFGIGLHKTGTTTLIHCLSLLGLKRGPDSFMTNKWINGKYGPIFDVVKKFDAFADSPWNHPLFYKHLDKEFPKSKFILTTRNTDNWLVSFKRFAGRDVKQKYVAIRKAIYNCTSSKDMSEKYCRDVFENHNKNVSSYFGSSKKLLVINWEN